MSRKRAMFPIIYEGCEGSKGNINCVKEFEEARRVPYVVPLSKSRLLIALLDDVHFLLSSIWELIKKVTNKSIKKVATYLTSS